MEKDWFQQVLLVIFNNWKFETEEIIFSKWDMDQKLVQNSNGWNNSEPKKRTWWQTEQTFEVERGGKTLLLLS